MSFIPGMANHGAVTKLYSSTIITANQKAIDDFLTNVATYINYDKTGMLAP
jgi:hypothetical protein